MTSPEDIATIAGKLTSGEWHVGGKDGTIVFDRDGWAIADFKSFHGRHADGEAQSNAHLGATHANPG